MGVSIIKRGVGLGFLVVMVLVTACTSQYTTSQAGNITITPAKLAEECEAAGYVVPTSGGAQLAPALSGSARVSSFSKSPPGVDCGDGTDCRKCCYKEGCVECNFE